MSIIVQRSFIRKDFNWRQDFWQDYVFLISVLSNYSELMCSLFKTKQKSEEYYKTIHEISFKTGTWKITLAQQMLKNIIHSNTVPPEECRTLLKNKQ